MDPKKLFFDQRFSNVCVYCGDNPDTRDHVPSRVLLDEPFPGNLPVVNACEKCNNSFSVDEPYLACLIECAIHGSTDPDLVKREKISRILQEKPKLAATIEASRCEDLFGNVSWGPDTKRVRNIVLKLARGHVAYECSEPQLDEPEHLVFIPLSNMSLEELQLFECPPKETIWPEIGSRAFVRAVVGPDVYYDNGWHVIQPGRYRYLVSYGGPLSVRIVLSEYLGCEVMW